MVLGCAVSRRYINVCNCDMFGVVNVYLDHLKFCVLCIDGRRYVCCSECNAGYKTDHRAVLAFTDQCTSGGTGPYRSALVRTGQHWSVYTREASEIFKLSGC